MTTLAEHWAELARVGLLGTVRRPAPEPPPGPLRDLLDADPPPDHAESVLTQVAAVAAARRAGLRPSPPVPEPEPCPPDERPLCPAPASRRLFELLESAPALIDEWLALVESRGFRLAPDVAVALLARYRHDSTRRAIVARAAGPLAGWISDQFPESLGARRDAGGAPAPMPDDFASAAGVPAAEAVAFVDRVLTDRGRARRDHPLLVRLLARVDPSTLATHVAALERRAEAQDDSVPFALALLDVARTRRAMIDELS